MASSSASRAIQVGVDSGVGGVGSTAAVGTSSSLGKARRVSAVSVVGVVSAVGGRVVLLVLVGVDSFLDLVDETRHDDCCFWCSW